MTSISNMIKPVDLAHAVVGLSAIFIAINVSFNVEYLLVGNERERRCKSDFYNSVMAGETDPSVTWRITLPLERRTMHERLESLSGSVEYTTLRCSAFLIAGSPTPGGGEDFNIRNYHVIGNAPPLWTQEKLDASLLNNK